MNNAQSMMIVMPELILTVFALMQVLIAAIIPNRRAKAYGLLAILGFALTAFAMFSPDRLHFLMDGRLPEFGFCQYVCR